MLPFASLLRRRVILYHKDFLLSTLFWNFFQIFLFFCFSYKCHPFFFTFSTYYVIITLRCYRRWSVDTCGSLMAKRCAVAHSRSLTASKRLRVCFYDIITLRCYRRWSVDTCGSLMAKRCAVAHSRSLTASKRLRVCFYDIINSLINKNLVVGKSKTFSKINTLSQSCCSVSLWRLV